MIAPPWFTVPPQGYGGVENMCADLVDGLVERGHEVTLIGAGNPGTKAGRFVPTYTDPPSGRLGESLPEVLHTAAVAQILAGLDIDLVHDHTLAGPLLARGRGVPTVVTMHGPVAGEPGEYYRQLGDTVDLVAISRAQRHAAPDLPWLGTVYNAIDVESFPYRCGHRGSPATGAGGLPGARPEPLRRRHDGRRLRSALPKGPRQSNADTSGRIRLPGGRRGGWAPVAAGSAA
jgi:hypothetical protein